MLKTPLLFLVFNRPDVTRVVFDKIKQVRPKQLFIAADGARPHKSGEQEKTEKVREIVLQGIDWDCEVKTLFRDENLGCARAVGGAITWFFEQVEQGIILEDDCVPDSSFFNFCEELLDKYAHDDQVMHISGLNLHPKTHHTNESYYFSQHPSIWGWATWKKAWNKYDFEMTQLDHLIATPEFSSVFPNDDLKQHLVNQLSGTKSGQIDSWGYRWLYTFWQNQGIGITPKVNLVQNIGFGEDATHTTQPGIERLGIASKSLSNLVHPTNKAVNRQADAVTLKEYFLGKTPLKESLKNGMKTTIAQLLPKKIKHLIKVNFLKFTPSEEKQLIAQYLPQNPIIVEAGAHVGFDSAQMARYWKKGQLFCFEPIPHIYNQLLENTRYYKNIKTYKLALGEKNGKSDIYVSQGAQNASSSLLAPQDHLEIYPDIKFDEKIEIETVNLDDWAKQAGVSKIDFMWLDLQGFEFPVLNSAPNILKTVTAIYTEVHTQETYTGVTQYVELRQFLEKVGFEVKHEDLSYQEGGNVLFVRKT